MAKKKKKEIAIIGEFKRVKKSPVMAKWGPMKWVFKSKKMLPIENDLSISYSLNEKNKREKIPVSFSYVPNVASGANVRKELERWKKLLGKSYPLYIGKKRFGPRQLKLVSVDESDIEVYSGGATVSASISLSFEERRKKAKKSSKKKTNNKLSSAKKTNVKKAKSK